ncbi:hypothetical protein RIF29_29972 [Crotalaria pallida]|uniref:Uncharacterized protein n=1 Tax=Crotalaria pallida TaxID=3830 RepID=A0AAN9EHM1_CROPI
MSESSLMLTMVLVKISAMHSEFEIARIEPVLGKSLSRLSNTGNSMNILWFESLIQKLDRRELLQQKGCVIWLTGLSGSGFVSTNGLNKCKLEKTISLEICLRDDMFYKGKTITPVECKVFG